MARIVDDSQQRSANTVLHTFGFRDRSESVLRPNHDQHRNIYYGQHIARITTLGHSALSSSDALRRVALNHHSHFFDYRRTSLKRGSSEQQGNHIFANRAAAISLSFQS